MPVPCPSCGRAGGVMLFTSIAPCDRCAGKRIDKSVQWDGTLWPPPIGARVQRGPKWRYDDQDEDANGTRVAGTVDEYRDSWVRVTWDTGRNNIYPKDTIKPA